MMLLETKKPFVIVVSHDRTKERYRRFIKDGRTKVLVFYELAYFLNPKAASIAPSDNEEN